MAFKHLLLIAPTSMIPKPIVLASDRHEENSNASISTNDQKLIETFDAIPPRAIPSVGTYEFQRFHFHWRPVMLQDSTNGRILVDLCVLRDHILPELLFYRS